MLRKFCSFMEQRCNFLFLGTVLKKYLNAYFVVYSEKLYVFPNNIHNYDYYLEHLFIISNVLVQPSCIQYYCNCLYKLDYVNGYVPTSIISTIQMLFFTFTSIMSYPVRYLVSRFSSQKCHQSWVSLRRKRLQMKKRLTELRLTHPRHNDSLPITPTFQFSNDLQFA